jgi:hypothetical protein
MPTITEEGKEEKRCEPVGVYSFFSWFCFSQRLPSPVKPEIKFALLSLLKLRRREKNISWGILLFCEEVYRRSAPGWPGCHWAGRRMRVLTAGYTGLILS